MLKSDHVFKTEGSDTPPRRLIGMCSCGWRGDVHRQDADGRALAEMEWEQHVGLVARKTLLQAIPKLHQTAARQLMAKVERAAFNRGARYNSEMVDGTQDG